MTVIPYYMARRRLAAGAAGGGGGLPEPGSLTDFWADNGATVPNYGNLMMPGLYHAGTNRTYHSWEGWDGSERGAYVSYYDHTTGLSGPVARVGTHPLTNNDHGNPSLVKDHDDHLWCFYGSHGTGTTAHIGVTLGPITEAINGRLWDVVDDHGDGLTYPKPNSVGSHLYVFYRHTANTVDLGRHRLFKTATLADGVATWDAAKDVIDFGSGSRCYSSEHHVIGTEIHFLANWADNDDTTRQHAYYCIFETTDGSLSNWDKSTTVASGSLPINKATADSDFRIFAHAGSNHGFTPTLAFDAGDVPHVTISDGSGSSFAVKYLTVDSGAWTTPETIETRPSRFAGSGPIIPRSGGKLWLVDSDTSTELMTVRERSAAGSWGDKQTTMAYGTLDLAGICAIRNGHDDALMTFFERAATSNDADAGDLRGYIWGESGLLARVDEPVVYGERHAFVYNFTAPTSTGNVSYKDPRLGGLTPKGAVLILSRVTADKQNETTGAYYSFGVTDGTNQWGTWATDEDNVASEDTYRGANNTRMGSLLDGSGSPEYRVVLNSMVSNGIRLSWTAVGSDEIMCTLVLFAGEDVSVKAGHIEGVLAAGTTVSGVGFEPDAILFASANLASHTNSSSTSFNISAGWAVNADPVEQTGTQLARNSGSNDEVTHWRDDTVGYFATEVTAFGADGFDIRRNNGSDAPAFQYYLAVKIDGGSFKTTHDVANTSTGTQAKTGVGFKPDLGIFQPLRGPTEGSPSDTTQMGRGTFAVDGNLTHGGASFYSVSTGTTQANSTGSDSAIVQQMADGAIDYEFTIQSWDADGYTANYTDAAAAAYVIPALLIGGLQVPE